MLAEERVFKYAIANEGSGGDLSTKLVTSRLPQQHGAFLRELPAEIIRHACVGLVQNRPGPRRERVRETFERCNRIALASYSGERAALYARLKLAGLSGAPCQLAVFVDKTTLTGHQLGRQTMPETLQYSALTAVHTFWLAARAYSVGVGWISILDPHEITQILEVPDGWELLAYLCVGYPEEEHLDPELERHGWQAREDRRHLVLHR